MSLKPIKKTDELAPWNKKSNPSKYSIGSRIQNKKFLIVCEGQTEKVYSRVLKLMA